MLQVPQSVQSAWCVSATGVGATTARAPEGALNSRRPLPDAPRMCHGGRHTARVAQMPCTRLRVPSGHGLGARRASGRLRRLNAAVLKRGFGRPAAAKRSCKRGFGSTRGGNEGPEGHLLLHCHHPRLPGPHWEQPPLDASYSMPCYTSRCARSSRAGRLCSSSACRWWGSYETKSMRRMHACCLGSVCGSHRQRMPTISDAAATHVVHAC